MGVAKELLPATHLILDSEGPSSESRRGHALGQYRLLGDKCNGRAAYRQLHTVRFRKKRDEGRKIFLSYTGEAWEVSESLGESRGNLRCVSNSPLPPSTGWEYFVWHGQGQWFADPYLKVTEGLLKPCAKIKVDLPETLYDNFFPTSLSSRRTPPPFQATFYPVGQWCSGRPVYQTSDHAEETEEDVLCGSSEKANIEKEVDRQEENIDKEAVRGERLLVRGGYWEVQMEKRPEVEFPLLQSSKGRLHPSNSGDWQVKDHERSWDEVSVAGGGLWRKVDVEVTSMVDE